MPEAPARVDQLAGTGKFTRLPIALLDARHRLNLPPELLVLALASQADRFVARAPSIERLALAIGRSKAHTYRLLRLAREIGWQVGPPGAPDWAPLWRCAALIAHGRDPVMAQAIACPSGMGATDSGMGATPSGMGATDSGTDATPSGMGATLAALQARHQASRAASETLET